MYPDIIGIAILANHKTLEENIMSKQYRQKHVMQIQRVLSGKCNSISISAYPGDIKYLEKNYPVEAFFMGYIRKIPGLGRYKIKIRKIWAKIATRNTKQSVLERERSLYFLLFLFI